MLFGDLKACCAVTIPCVLRQPADVYTGVRPRGKPVLCAKSLSGVDMKNHFTVQAETLEVLEIETAVKPTFRKRNSRSRCANRNIRGEYWKFEDGDIRNGGLDETRISSDGFVGFAPPPPPPPAPGTTVRLNTQIPDVRGKQGSCREPPAAIQNAMMTKDKKPFTYTPGGLDLSQIRSPRMQRRISRNAHNEGAAPKPPPLGQGALPPSALAAMQPQLPVQVFPSGVPQHTSAPKRPVIQEVPQPPPPPTPPTPPTPASQNVEPGSLYVPPVTSRVQLGSLYVPPVTNAPTPQQQQHPQGQMSPLPSGGLNKAPTPWMSQRTQPQPVAAWASRAEDPATRTVQGPPGTRIIPIQVLQNDTDTGSDNIQEAGWGATGAPIQSRAFKVLQKITDTDVGDGGGVDHIAPGRQGVPMQQQQRKLQLNEDDRALMNKFKAQGIYYNITLSLSSSNIVYITQS
uniref:Uncharacterized protein n=1 Tax=Timema douglasi TaxID=61478 RepID=A0A7R8VWG8_TIMDO|nr:unnamed protein product [Timema douglasi]